MASTAREREEQSSRAGLIRKRKIALFVMALLCVYFLYSIVSTQIEIYKEKKALNALLEQINEKQLENDELSRIVVGEGEEAYIERIAREKLGYAAADERVFEDAAGTGDEANGA